MTILSEFELHEHLEESGIGIGCFAVYTSTRVSHDVPIWIRLHHSGLAELLDLARKPQIHFFCPYQQAAESIVQHIVTGEAVT